VTFHYVHFALHDKSYNQTNLTTDYNSWWTIILSRL